MNIRTHTPSFEQFDSNLQRVAHFFEALRAGFLPVKIEIGKIESRAREFPLLSESELSKIAQELTGLRQEIESTEERDSSILQWVPVMLVTVTEAYLQDVLAYVAATDASLMSNSKQTAEYSDVLEAQSIEDLAAHLRERWARSIVNDGGPRKWIRKLPQILQFPKSTRMT